MSGISSKALGFGGYDNSCGCPNKKGFNGNEIQNKEFSDGSGLEVYDFNARTYDPQIGRFLQIDPSPDDGDQESLTPYHFAGNNPVLYNDPDGNCPWCLVFWIVAEISAESVATATVVSAGTTLTVAAVADAVANSRNDDASITVTTSDGGYTMSSPLLMGTGGNSVSPKSYKKSSGETTNSKNQSSSNAAKLGAEGGKYSNLKEPNKVGAGKDFTPAQKKRIIEENKRRNGGEIKSDKSGKTANPAKQSKKGQPADMNQAEIDHVKPKSKGGTNSNNNAQVLTKEENLKKTNN